MHTSNDSLDSAVQNSTRLFLHSMNQTLVIRRNTEKQGVLRWAQNLCF